MAKKWPLLTRWVIVSIILKAELIIRESFLKKKERNPLCVLFCEYYESIDNSF